MENPDNSTPEAYTVEAQPAVALDQAKVNPDGSISGIIGNARVLLQSGLDGQSVYLDD